MSNTLKFGAGEWATKKGSTLAYNSENGNFKPLPFTFDRSTSATRVNKEGLIEVVSNNEPRIDYKDDSKGALLLEPSRSNLILSSEDISGTGWGRSGWTLTNDFISPDGTNNAYSILRTTGVGVSTTLSLLANTTYTFSAYIKNIDATNIQLRVQNAAGNSSGTESNCVVFQVTDQTNTDDFVRITHTFNTGDAGSYGIFLGYYSAGEYIVWGVQVEQGSYATSYIPTQGSIGTIDAESCVQTPPSGIIGQTEGSVYIEGTAILDTNGSMPFTIYLNSSNILYCWFRANGIIDIDVFAGTFQDRIRTSVDTIANGDYFKLSVGYKSNDLVAYLNGVQIGTASPTLIPSCSSLIVGGYIAADYTGSLIKETKLYNTRLSNTELQALTKI